MQIDNIFQMNKWEINKFLKMIFAIQISLLGLVLIDSLGLHITILREIISLVYLLFVPGILILRIMKMHKLGSVETILYSMGLSIASIMFLGLIINLVYPLLKILNPISLLPLIITMMLFVFILSILSYLRDKDFYEPSFIDIKELISPIVLFLFLFPFLAILGTYLMNWYKINIVLMLLIILICAIVILFAYGKIPKKFYPLTIFIVAISLLYHTSLISSYVTGWDIQNEYYLANVVIKNAVWNYNINSIINAMLSVTMFAPIFSIISKMSLDWVFKIVYPLIFSLVPLGLYKIYEKQTNNEIAFLSSFLFISFFVFYTEMLALARQEIAEFFLVLLIMLMVNKEMSKIKRSFLFIIFGVSLVVSHYGLSYIYMFSLVIVYMLVLVFDHYDIQKLINFIFRNKSKNYVTSFKENENYKIINITFIIFFIVFAIAWYMYVSSSASLTVMLNMGNQIVSSISTDFLNSNSVQGLAIVQTQLQSPLHMLGKYVYLIVQFFILIGFLALLLKKNRMNFQKEYLAFIVVNFIILLAAVTLPFFSSSLNTERLYQINLIFLAPVCIIGGITVLNLFKYITFFKGFNFHDASVKLISIFLVVFLLFNVGFIYYIFNEDSISISLNTTADTASYNQEEIRGAEWIYIYGSNPLVITDDYRSPLMSRFDLPVNTFSVVYGDNSSLEDMNVNLKAIQQNNSVYLFFGTRNINDNSVMIFDKQGVNVANKKYKSLNNLFFVENKIYDNNGSQIYLRN